MIPARPKISLLRRIFNIPELRDEFNHQREFCNMAMKEKIYVEKYKKEIGTLLQKRNNFNKETEL
jgi:hypothetical protein